MVSEVFEEFLPLEWGHDLDMILWRSDDTKESLVLKGKGSKEVVNVVV